MSGITDLARHIKSRDNPAPHTPVFGTIISLPELKIQLGSRIFLDAEDVNAIFDLYEKKYDDDGRFIGYKYLNKEAVLLPYSDDNKFIVIGVVV